MHKTILVLLAAVFIVPVVHAAGPQDVTAPIHQFIDGFNSGDVKAAYAAYASGNIVILDEFAPHLWSGPHAAQDWADDYGKNAQSRGVSDGSVKYGAPTRSVVEGEVAYVVIPTVYNYKEHGKATTERGQMTFVLHAENNAWKIAGWTWTGTVPHPAK
jgi:ketosteroid isomerase-like protein